MNCIVFLSIALLTSFQPAYPVMRRSINKPMDRPEERRDINVGRKVENARYERQPVRSAPYNPPIISNPSNASTTQQPIITSSTQTPPTSTTTLPSASTTSLQSALTGVLPMDPSYTVMDYAQAQMMMFIFERYMFDSMGSSSIFPDSITALAQALMAQVTSQMPILTVSVIQNSLRQWANGKYTDRVTQGVIDMGQEEFMPIIMNFGFGQIQQVEYQFPAGTSTQAQAFWQTYPASNNAIIIFFQSLVNIYTQFQAIYQKPTSAADLSDLTSIYSIPAMFSALRGLMMLANGNNYIQQFIPLPQNT